LVFQIWFWKSNKPADPVNADLGARTDQPEMVEESGD
jgi:hypothetical protein